jgi:hypothetical protein
MMAGLPVAQPDSPNLTDVSGNNAAVPTSIGDDSVFGRIVNKLTGSNGVERQQLWPERLVRNALSVIPEGLEGKIPMWQLNPQTGEFKVHPEMIEKALDMAALAGTGGLGGAELKAGETALGGGPFLRPALKYKEKLYKAPQGGQHLDALPKELESEFQRLAMSGEDISHFNFGFMNHKGQFLDREKALQYAIDEGLLDPHNGKFGVLTSSMELNQPSAINEYVPAIKSKNKIYSGNDHPSIEAKYKLQGQSQEDGFIDKNGNFLNRNEFENKFGVRESDDLKAAQR